MRIGLFGGSFNPIHTGHVALARQLKTLAELDEVWLMVSPQNPLKPAAGLLDDRLRYQMARIALHGEKGIMASSYELHLPRPSYTWNTLEHLKEDYPLDTFILLIGGDNWARFRQWFRADDIVSNYQIVVYPRRGSDIDPTELPTNVHVVETPLLDISSTDIRHRVGNGQSIANLVAKEIEPLVKRLYTDPSGL